MFRWGGNRFPRTILYEVEWLYSFDVHCNACVPAFGIFYLLHFVLLPFLSTQSFAASFASNMLTLSASIVYFYFQFRGFSDVGVVREPGALLVAPSLIAFIVFLLFTIFRINPTRLLLAVLTGY